MLFANDGDRKRELPRSRTEIVRDMMDPLSDYPDGFDRVSTSPYRQLMADMWRAPTIKPDEAPRFGGVARVHGGWRIGI